MKDVKKKLKLNGREFIFYDIGALDERVARLPLSIKVLLESAVRNCNNYDVSETDVQNIIAWSENSGKDIEIPFKPARVILQDFTGVPAVVDLAALRSAMKRMNGDPGKINPLVPVDLVIDHSVQVDVFGSADALEKNIEIEFQRNAERYTFLKWGQTAFENFSTVPPAVGIVHQANLEFIAKVVQKIESTDGTVVLPDSLVGTDSHTTMINGLGVLGWGVGGIEAEAVMLGQPIYMLLPEVVGFRLTGKLQEGVTATDVVLTVVKMLREKGVVGKFVEFYGEGLDHLTLADRATISNMAPEYGATIGFFPVDDEALRYLTQTGRPDELVKLVEASCKAQGLFRIKGAPEPDFSDTLSLDISTVKSSLAGPKRPQDKVFLTDLKADFNKSLVNPVGAKGFGLKQDDLNRKASIKMNGSQVELKHGDVVIAAITSCTNTSNPSVMIGAGILAKRAVEKGLGVKPFVKTSLAPGSRVVTEYLKESGLLPFLEKLRFNVVGYGCTTCIGNSGPLPKEISEGISDADLVVASVLSGNRNFEGRVNPDTRANYLASPLLVVAYALAGTVDIDLTSEPIGTGSDGKPVYLKEIWPTQKEINDLILTSIQPRMFESVYSQLATLNPRWNQIEMTAGDLYDWREDSTYIQEPPFFMDLADEPGPIQSINGARVLALLGDSVTTDHISPAGSIPKDSPAAQYLVSNGVQPKDFNSFGSRRGNDRVMTRGTFGNIRIRNRLAPGTEGGYTTYLPDGKVMFIYDAAQKYRETETPLVVIAGKEYGTGSSRDWAAKGTYLLGVRAVIAESFERIHRSNLVGMGVLPLQFKPGENAASLGLSGKETFSFSLSDEIKPKQNLVVNADDKSFEVSCRIDTEVEIDYYRNGGILQFVLRKLMKGN